MAFLAIVERDSPGTSERLVALMYIEQGSTYLMDGNGVSPHPIVNATVKALAAQCAPVSLSARRAVLITDDSKLEKLKRLVGNPIAV